jgi:hypothetical protein
MSSKHPLVSIVIQGPVFNFTHKCIKSIKEFFPNCQLILSTWDDADLSNLDLNDVQLVQQKPPDPGYMNIKRQLFSSRLGMDNCKNDYIMKVRSDLIFTSNNCLNYLGQIAKNSVFSEKIVVPNMQTIDPENESKDQSWHRVFNISDWAMLGRKDDIIRLFDNAMNKPLLDLNSSKYAPEQHLWLASIVQDKLPIPENMIHRSAELIKACKYYYANNLVVLNATQQFSCYSVKYAHQYDHLSHLFDHDQWRRSVAELENEVCT